LATKKTQGRLQLKATFEGEFMNWKFSVGDISIVVLNLSRTACKELQESLKDN